MKNWKTTTIGAVVAACVYAFPHLAEHITSVGILLLSFFSKDSDK